MAWVKETFTAVANWARETYPGVLAWLADAGTNASQPSELLRITHGILLIKSTVKEHPRATLVVSGFIFLGPQVLLLPLFILQTVFYLFLTVIGFGASGVVGGMSPILTHYLG